MRVKNFLLMFIVLMFLASLAMVNVPVQSSSSPVTFAVDMPAQGYINGSDVPLIFPVDILIDASGLTPNSSEGMIGWGIDVQVDPAVLEPIGVVGADAGFFLYDFLVDWGYNIPPYVMDYVPTMVPWTINTETGYIDEITEQVMPPSPGGAGGTGILVRIAFKSLDNTTYSPIQIGLFQAGDWQAMYYDANKTWHEAVAIDGHYNDPGFLYLHSQSSLIDLSSLVTSSWHELYPGYSNISTLNSWIDNDDDVLSPCDFIELNDTWYHVEEVTVTIYASIIVGEEELNTTNSPVAVGVGTWTDPINALSSDTSYASSSTPGAEQGYGAYGFSIPGGAMITKVEVGYEAFTAGSEGIGITCSWDGGGSWAAVNWSGSLTKSDPGVPTWVDFTGATSWAIGNLSDANFATKAIMEDAGGGSKATNLDWIPARVTYSVYVYEYMYIDYIIGFDYMDEAIDNPNRTMWHEIYPVFGNVYNLTGWVDVDVTSNLTMGDNIKLNGTTYNVEDLDTDIVISGPIVIEPEFPLGLAVEIGLIAAIAYVLWRSRRKTKITKQAKPAYRPHQ